MNREDVILIFLVFFPFFDNSKPPGGQMQKLIISNFAHWCIQWLSTSFLFIVYINYDHGSHKLWKFWFSAKFSKKYGRQSAILDRINLIFCTPIHSMIIYKFPIHYVYKLRSWVTQIMKDSITGKIQQEKWPPVSHLGSDRPVILQPDRFHDLLQVCNSLCK